MFQCQKERYGEKYSGINPAQWLDFTLASAARHRDAEEWNKENRSDGAGEGGGTCCQLRFFSVF